MTQQTTNQNIGHILREIGEYLAMQDVAFKPQAYERAADTIAALDEELAALYEEGGTEALEELPGIGANIAEKIEELVTTGHLQYYEELKKEMPVDLEGLTAIESVGPKTVQTLWKQLGITTVDELEKAAKAGRIQELEGFGEKSEQNILQGIAFLRKSEGRFVLGFVIDDVRAIVERLDAHAATKRVTIAGSVRRYKETIGDADILITTENPAEATQLFVAMPEVDQVLLEGETKSRVRLHSGLEVDLRVVAEEEFGSALQYFTGSKEHNVVVRGIAKEQRYKLNEYGLFAGEERIAGATEEEIYTAIGFQQIPPPEMRINTGEIEAAQEGSLPTVIGYDDLRGDLQIQTDWTDGKHSMRAMAEAARDQGLSYIAITDHTQSLGMAGGLNERRLRRQVQEIEALNETLDGITILKSSEVDILKDGTLDIDDETLALLDVVGIAVHSHLSMNEQEMTDRIVRAMQNPHVDILFHPTGRIIKRRDAYAVDMDRIVATAQETGVALEINAFPTRLDLRDSHIRKAVDAEGVMFAISTDAHHKDHLRYLEFGIGQARRGWVQKENVINAMSLTALQKWLKTHRS